LNVTASFRFRQATDPDVNADTSRQWSVGATYDVTKSTYVGLGYSYLRGDGVQNGDIYRVSYGVRF
jgi:opacity protein-like surface antigen